MCIYRLPSEKHNVRNTKYNVDTQYIAHRTWKKLHLTWYRKKPNTWSTVPNTSYQVHRTNYKCQTRSTMHNTKYKRTKNTSRLSSKKKEELHHMRKCFPWEMQSAKRNDQSTRHCTKEAGPMADNEVVRT